MCDGYQFVHFHRFFAYSGNPYREVDDIQYPGVSSTHWLFVRMVKNSIGQTGGHNEFQGIETTNVLHFTSIQEAASYTSVWLISEKTIFYTVKSV
jgi:hypothetical protein